MFVSCQAAEDVAPGQVNTGETTATTLVTITVRDVNDNRPLFGQQNYRATILENMQEGVPVGFQGPIMQVSDIDQVRFPVSWSYHAGLRHRPGEMSCLRILSYRSQI